MIEVAHWSALIPLAVLVLRRDVPAAFWLVAVGFACSFAADTAADISGGSWAFVPYYLTVQYALFAVALTQQGARKVTPALVVYCGIGALLYRGMVARIEDVEAFMSWWYPYQGVRLASFGLFVWAARRV